uniref:BTB domain-containing protein n=1 Tax=Panagrolaimus sp. PS1159 TaxID=55785 RepID=A0AC35GU77_9BILA
MYKTAILTVDFNDKNDETISAGIPEFRPLETMTSILYEALTTKEFADVIFLTNDSQKVYANQCILYSQSNIFKALFDEKPEIPTEIEVNFSQDIVFRAMKFCYGKIDIIENCEGELINFAGKFGIKELKKVCLKFLELRILDCENVCDIVKLAFQHDYNILKAKCVAFLRENKSKIGDEKISKLPIEILVSTIMSFN